MSDRLSDKRLQEIESYARAFGDEIPFPATEIIDELIAELRSLRAECEAAKARVLPNLDENRRRLANGGLPNSYPGC